jgi:hypothetical protein
VLLTVAAPASRGEVSSRRMRVYAGRRLEHIEPRLRGAALFPAAVYAVHQLRYELAFGGRAGHELAAQGHGYLDALVLPIVLVAAMAVGAFAGHLQLVRASRPAARPGAPESSPLLRAWLPIAFALVAVYAGQESLEGLLAAGHPAGLAGIFGSGGWLAVPVALAVAALLAALLRIARVVLAGVATRALRTARAAAPAPRRHAAPAAHPRAPLARQGAGRAPPAW